MPRQAEDNMNSRMEDITFTARDGQVSHLQAVYIRGSKIRCGCVVVPGRVARDPATLRN